MMRTSANSMFSQTAQLVLVVLAAVVVVGDVAL